MKDKPTPHPQRKPYPKTLGSTWEAGNKRTGEIQKKLGMKVPSLEEVQKRMDEKE